jgi:hypothetical protein
MLLLLHGDAGSWDEIAIAVAAFVVLWVAVKLAGRKANDDEDEDEAELGVTEAAVAEAGVTERAEAEPVEEPARRPAHR